MAKVSISGRADNILVLIDGREVKSVHSLRLDALPGDFPILSLEIVVTELDIQMADVSVRADAIVDLIRRA